MFDSELPSTSLEGTSVPQCRYDVLSSINGPAIRVVNVGDPVVHKWSCDSGEFRVYTSLIPTKRQPLFESESSPPLTSPVVPICPTTEGFEVGWTVQGSIARPCGCVVESNLVPDVIYAVDLSSAHTTINAFRFADQIMVHFSCQITLCRKRDQGCEGISPPTCHPIEFPPIQAVYRQSSSSTNQPTVKVAIDDKCPDNAPPADYPTLVPAPSAPSPDQTTRDDKETYSSSQGAKEYGLEISNKEEEKFQEGSPRRVQGYRTETLSSVYDLPPGMALEPLPTPTPADVFFAANRRLRSKRNGVENITVEVEAKRILVLSSDESDHIDATTIERSEFVDTSQCGRVLVTQTLFLCAAALMQVTSVAVILVQRRIYHRNLRAAAMRPKSSNGY
ncbi:unnamed protein product [Nippostrongylus brasiliensis]|uniref:ZP domain-containing protein n=1 Tax=Nippostrongylus brasiliensis TaxID=27835 RepID=A0A0N4XYG9_NIPBR|nr:unnamed protein product [Nippostrongylus brasiliensis]